MIQENQPIWHPCSQMNDMIDLPAALIESATGATMTLADGRQLIDANASWWCKSLGHNHPAIEEAIISQTQTLQHSMLANTSSPALDTLSETLTSLLPKLDKVYYACDGATAVEIALKMAHHARLKRGQGERKRFLCLANGYHGESTLAMSVSDLGIYKKPYQELLYPHVTVLSDLPTVLNHLDPQWSDASAAFQAILPQLEAIKPDTNALIFEPILQGAGGMRLISKDFLERLMHWARNNDIYIICDEITTCMGRTGKLLASEYFNITPDFLCLGKGLTGGALPMSATLTTSDVQACFADGFETEDHFLHSNAYAGNAVCAAAANACINTLQHGGVLDQTPQLTQKLANLMTAVAGETKKLHNVRYIGGVVAADLIAPENVRMGWQVFQEAMKLGALLRPLGNSIYWLVPLTISDDELERLADITSVAIQQAYQNNPLNLSQVA